MSFVQAGTTPERLVQAVAATADANGLISFRLGPAPLGYVWQGSVTITNAPSGALFTSSVASTPWGQHAGPTNFGPVQLWGNETLVVNGVGLQKLTQYSMLFFGVSIPEAQATPMPPVAPTSVVGVETATVLLNGVAAQNSGNSVTITPPTLTRRLTVIVKRTLTTDVDSISVNGVQTGALYGIWTFAASGTSPEPAYFPLEPAIDTSYTIQLNQGGGGLKTVTLWALASATNPLVEADINGNQIVFVLPSPIAPLNVVGIAGEPIRVRPPTQFTGIARLINPAAGSTLLLAAPPAGQINVLGTFGAYRVAAAVHEWTLTDGGGNVICSVTTNGTSASENIIFATTGALNLFADGINGSAILTYAQIPIP